MQDSTNTGKCRYCDATIFWFKSKSGKNYPCDSDNRRDFHKCAADREEASDSYKPPRGDSAIDEELRVMMQLLVSTGYRQLALKHHPDHGGKDEDMLVVNQAVERLRELLEGR